MNAPFLTQGAEGHPRRRFTNADIERMVEAGVFEPDEPMELIKGEILPMASEHDLHARARVRLWQLFSSRLDTRRLFVASEVSLFLSDDIEIKPDLHVFLSELRSHDVRGADVMLAVEIAASTQKRDIELKAPIYAAHGVRELRVLDLDAMRSHVFRAPGADGYGAHEELAADAALTPMEFDEVSVRLADLV